MQKALCALAASIFLAACGEKTVTAPPTDGIVIGVAHRAFEDADRLSWDRKRARPLATTVWYPSAAPAKKMEEIAFPAENPIFVGGWAAPDAEISVEGRAPLIILSHGTGGSAFQMMWLGRRLAAHGFIVAALDHHGNTAAEAKFDPRGFNMPWERARDVSALIDLMLADPQFGPKIDATKIGGAGFSLGGYTMAALAGARTSLDLFQKFCASPDRDATCEPQGEYPEAGAEFAAMLDKSAPLRAALAEHRISFADPRMSAFVLIAPALAQALTDESLLSVKTDILVIGATNDDVAPAGTNARRLAGKMRRAQFETIEGAGHYSFLDECSKRGRRFVPVCRDAPGYDRVKGHDKVAGLAIGYFTDAFSSPVAATLH
ncbi:MAG: hypothetical protein KDD85_04070 [Parvularculaceae bacterium]|nr:hypothetical protein [Parvularculaceae bacterium]